MKLHSQLHLLAALPVVGGALLAQVPTADGDNVPNIGMQHLKADDGLLPSTAFTLPDGTIAPTNPAPLGTVLPTGVWLPDTDLTGGQAALDELLRINSDDEYPQELYMTNTDPSGSLDGSVVDPVTGEPIHFNLHYPPEAPDPFWLEDQGMDPRSPTELLNEILDEIATTGSKTRVQEAVDILLGTNDSGAMDDKAFNGIPLLRYQAAADRKFDHANNTTEVTQLWYGTEIRSDVDMLEVPTHGDFTITWKVRGLGDTGENRMRAFPIDEFTPMIMKKTGNSLFWKRNSWVWKWLGIVDTDVDGRKYSLETLFHAHTGTDAAPSYSDLNPGDPRYWLHADRKFNFGSFVGGNGDIEDLTPWESNDLDMDGLIGGYLVDGTFTGSDYDADTNADAQFNGYGNNEYAVPMLDWSTGPYDMPHFSYDSSFATIRKGQGFDVTIRYGQGSMQAGIYNWGWRVHPPRINWIETYADGQILPSGAPKDWRFAHKWDEVAAMGLDAVGDNAPELRIYEALDAFALSSGDAAAVQDFVDATDGLMAFVEDRRGLPPLVNNPPVGFPNPLADANFVYSNQDMYGDRDQIAAAGKGGWAENDVITITIYNDDNYTRFFRVVDFGTTDYQYNGTDMGRLDWKPVYGFPQLASSAWGGLFSAQGYEDDFWVGTEVVGRANPFHVSPNESYQDPLLPFPTLNFDPQERDLLHHFDSLLGFSGPGYHNVQEGVFAVWGNNFLAGKPTGDPDIWDWSYGEPIAPGEVKTFHVEMPRAQALNNGAMYMFDPQFHSSSIFTMHPVSELKPELLDD